MHFFRVIFLTAATLIGTVAVPAATHKIGLLLKGDTSFWRSVEKGARQVAEANGAELIVRMPPSVSDVAIQIKYLSFFAAQGVEALVIGPTSADALGNPLKELAEKNIKIVIVDSPLNSKNDFVFVGADHEAGGEAAGRLLATWTQDQDEVAIFRHDQKSLSTLTREKKAIEILRQLQPKVVVHAEIYACTVTGAENERAAFLLSAYPQTKAILCGGSIGTVAMIRRIREQALSGTIKLAGFGYNLSPEIIEALKNDTITAWISQDTAQLGMKGVEAALGLLEGKPVAAKIPTEFIVVTKANLQETKIQNLLDR